MNPSDYVYDDVPLGPPLVAAIALVLIAVIRSTDHQDSAGQGEHRILAEELKALRTNLAEAPVPQSSFAYLRNIEATDILDHMLVLLHSSN